MEVESEVLESPVLNDSFKLPTRARSSQRFIYEAQIQVIKKQIGSLESVCRELGLSQRKLAQLLLVDPSAMTRWSREGEDAPPHIWRALQWYMSVREKIPGLTPQYFLASNTSNRNVEEPRWKNQFKKDLLEAHATIEALKNQTNELRIKIRIYAGFGIAVLAILFVSVFFIFARARGWIPG